MKKLLVVLTILVLVAGFAFADVAIKGKFVGTYTFDFTKDQESQYYNPADKSTFKLTLAADTKELTGDSGVYAKAAVSIDVSYDSAKYPGGVTGVEYRWSNYSNNLDGALVLSLDTVEIVGENWSLDLINTLNGVDYATDGFDKGFVPSIADKKNYYPTYSYSQKLAKKPWTVPGVTFNYDGFKVSAAYNNKFVEAKTGVYGNHFEKSLLIAVETKEFDFDGFKLQAFAGYAQGNKWLKSGATTYALGIEAEKVLTGSVKAGYETDDVKASVAADAGRVSGDETVYFDVAANVQVKPVVFDFYYAKKASYGYVDKYGAYIPLAPVDNFMSMKAVVALADIIENVPVTVTVKAKNVLNAAILSLSVNTTAVENFDITVFFNDFLKKAGAYQQNLGASVEYTGIENVTLSADVSYSLGDKVFDLAVGAEYEAEKFTASATVALEKYGADAELQYGLNAKISSDKIVSNATLAAEFVWDEFYPLIKDAWNFGKYLSLSCTIAW